MATNEIGLINGKPAGYDKYTINPFKSWQHLKAFADFAGRNPTRELATANSAFADYVNGEIRNGNVLAYGLFGKHPRSYEEALLREKFLYFDEYKRIKATVEKKIREELQKNSIVQAMRPKLVLNDKELGDFQFERATLQPQIFLYIPSQKREVNIESDKIIYKGEKMYLEDGSEVVRALKVTKNDGTIEFIELKEDDNVEEVLIEAAKKGIVSCTSSNKKVYLYKQKIPKIHKGIKIIIGLTAGGFTSWVNDFYTGIAAACCYEILESLDYSVHIEIIVGGGRCGQCWRKLYFDGTRIKGRRFFTFPVKTFDEQVDIESLLYTLCDPSFHNIKFISLLNNLFTFYGDELDTSGNPAGTWHGIEENDMVIPLGQFHKRRDIAKGDKNSLHFYIHQVGLKERAENVTETEFIRVGENAVIAQITDLILQCENKNLMAYQKAIS